ncbi:MAG TPA: hypothetical protein VGX00_06235 [Thermoplasmata archaeon]|nr:hypothetical protein [Thermoplasmata archaeon]
MFYNGAMALDRDLSVAVANVLAHRHGPRRRSGWEMLAATGVRSLRVLKESELFGSLLLTESNPAAYPVLAANVELAGAGRAKALHQDARRAPPGGPFDFIDLDPYGSPAPFLETAMGSAGEGSFLAVTATDLRVLAGADPDACARRYGALPIRGRLGSESGLRILIGWLALAARARGRALQPRLGYVHGHYLRVLAEFTGAAGPALPIERIDPKTFPGPQLPGAGPYGPMWTGPLLDPEFVEALAVPPKATQPQALAQLFARFAGEANVTSLFYFESNELARSLSLPSPPAVEPLIGRLRENGWRAARTHVRPGAFRTDAPRTEVERLARSTPG